MLVRRRDGGACPGVTDVRRRRAGASRAASPAAEVEVKAAVPQRAESDAVKERVLALVAEKTGYPADMLDLDLDLEADLGIDTVKQAEVFAAIREAYGIARDDKIRLREFPTLAHVIGFVNQRRPDLKAEAAAPAEPAPVAPPVKEAAGDPIADTHPGDWWWKRPAIRETCSTWISTWKPTWASTPSSRRRCSPPSARLTTSRAIRISSCAISRPWRT